jgi:tight adherence protein B
MTFLAGFLAVFGVNLFLADLHSAHRQSVRMRLEEELQLHSDKSLTDLFVQQSGSSTVPAAWSFSENGTTFTWWQRVGMFVEQSGKQTTPQQLLFWSLLAAAAAAAAPIVVLHQWLVALVASLVAASIPWIYVWRVRHLRLEKLRSQLPDVFDLMSRVLRAGQTISQALQTVAEESSRPAAEEFRYAYEQQNLGLSPEAAMRALARRTDLLELKIFVMAVTVHRQTGGNLADLLNKLAMIIRDRYRIRGMIRAMTAEGRLQAAILIALPPLLLAAVTLINRPYATILYQYPNLLAGMFSFMVAGAVWMQKIVNFDF